MRQQTEMDITAGDKPTGRVVATMAVLYLDRDRGDVALWGEPTATTEAYLRRLATTAGELADAVGKAVAESNAAALLVPSRSEP